MLLAALLLTACKGDQPEVLLASAKAYLAKNDSKAAVIQIKNALQMNPNLAQARFLLGVALLDDGDALGAETELRKALELNHPQDEVAPVLAGALLAQGQAKRLTDDWGQARLNAPSAQASLQTSLASAYAMLGKAELSRAALDAAVAAEPGYAPALVVQARQKLAQRDIDGAMALLDQAIAKSPQDPDAWKLKGDVLHFAKGNAADALAAYRKSIEIKPGFLAGHAAAVSLMLQQGNLADAALQMESMRKVAPHHPQTRYLEAQLAFQRKDFKLARELSQQVLKAAPNSVQALQLAGAVEIELNSLPQAQGYLSKAVQAAPDLALARRLLVAAYLRAGQADKAMAALLPGLNRDNVAPELFAVAGEVYLQMGDIKKAEQYFARAARHDPGDAKNRTSLALTHMIAGQVEAAFGELQDIAASDSGVIADLALISARLRRREFDQALKAIDGLEKKQPDKPMAANLRGRTLLAKQDVVGARKSFERAGAIDPTYFPAVASLAALDIADKKPDEARKRFEAVVAKDPKNVQALLGLAEIAARSGAAPEEVGRLIRQAVAANPLDAAPRLSLIGFYLRGKNVKQALAAAQDATAALPDSLEVLDALGLAQQAAGEFNQAIATFNRLAAMQPMSVQVHMRLADVHMAANDKVAASSSLRKGLEIKPDLLAAQRALILLDLDDKRVEDALATARAVQKQRPKAAAGYVLEGDINVSQKNWDGAADAYRAGLKQVNASELAVKLHSVLLASGKGVEADRLSSVWRRDNPKDALFLSYLGDAAMARKDYVLAEKNYAAVVKLQANNAAAYNNLAWVSAKLSRQGAIAYAEKANALAPNQPAFMDTLAVLLAEQGEYARAVELQNKVLALQPLNAVFKLNLAKMHIKGGKSDLARKELDELAKLGDKFSGQAEVANLLKNL
jgi:putative PEP-CTERM system TPR-repeat lipoprotein